MNRNQVFFKLRAHDTKNAPNLYSSKKRNVWRGGDVGDMLTCPPLVLSSWMGLISGDHSAVDPQPSPLLSLLSISPLFSPTPSPLLSLHLTCPTLSPSSHHHHSPSKSLAGVCVCARVCVCRQGPACACVQQRSSARTTQGTLSLSNPLEITERCLCVCVMLCTVSRVWAIACNNNCVVRVYGQQRPAMQSV